MFAAIDTKKIKLKWHNKKYFYLCLLVSTIAVFVISESTVNGGVFEVLGFKPFRIDSNTMEPALLEGDYIIVNLKYYKTGKPQRGDVIVFPFPKDRTRHFIKRVVALPGETIEVRDKLIYLNEKPWDDPYGIFKGGAAANVKNFGPYTVPEGHVFVLGDNRDKSYDSRFWGPLNISDIMGKARYIYWSKNKGRIGMEIK